MCGTELRFIFPQSVLSIERLFPTYTKKEVDERMAVFLRDATGMLGMEKARYESLCVCLFVLLLFHFSQSEVHISLPEHI